MFPRTNIEGEGEGEGEGKGEGAVDLFPRTYCIHFGIHRVPGETLINQK